MELELATMAQINAEIEKRHKATLACWLNNQDEVCGHHTGDLITILGLATHAKHEMIKTLDAAPGEYNEGCYES